jgi:hypothetical protein
MLNLGKKKFLGSLCIVLMASVTLPESARGQVPYDPTLAVKPAPNIMLLIDATRTTLINGATCFGMCHATGGHGSLDSYSIYRNGKTRLQLARTVLTGGWGWNSNGSVSNSDARVSTAGIMDTYRGYRWGVSWYDGSGVRLALDPTSDNELAQKTVIDFGQPCFEVAPGNSGTCVYGLNSWMPAVGSAQGSFTTSDGRQSVALQYLEEYWRPGVSPPQTPLQRQPKNGKRYGSPTSWIPGGSIPRDSSVIDGDPTNVLVNAPTGLTTGGCRRNFTIVLTDGHGGSRWNGLRPGDAAGNIYNMPGGQGVDLSSVPITQADGTVINKEFSNQVFAIWFGWTDQNNADEIADYGYDGKAGGGVNSIMKAFVGAPGGVISDLSALKAAFAQVLGLISEGDYVGATPSISRFGEHIIYSKFTIPNCEGLAPGQCNFGRPGDVILIELDNGELTPLPGEPGVRDETVSMGENLERMDHDQRMLLTSYPKNIGSGSTFAPPTEINCGSFGGGSSGRCGGSPVTTLQIPTPFGEEISAADFQVSVNASSPGNLSLFRNLSLKYNDLAYLTGDPIAKLEGGPFRGDWECLASNPSTCCMDSNNDGAPDGTNVSGGCKNARHSHNPRNAACLDRHFKISDIANSRPVIVGAPTGLAEDLARWQHFLNMQIDRQGSNLKASISASNTDHLVRTRDRVIYVGGNDGFLHAFLMGEATGSADTTNNVSIDYQGIPTACSGFNRTRCHGQELWSYSPGLVQESWVLLKAGHFYMIDGTPVVSDVLFTKGITEPSNSPNSFCNRHTATSCNDWEYRTVLVQCLGIGGPGCFAMDVTNPYNPQLLWEREFTLDKNTGQNPVGAPTARVTTTSRPQIHRVKRVVNGKSIPYYVAIMGGGMQEVEVSGASRAGTILVVGIEDGAYVHSPDTNLADADFAGTPTCIDADGDSYVDTCYILTTQADIYKVRFTNSDPSQGITLRKFFDGRLAVNDIFSDGSNSILSYTKLVATFDEMGRLNLFFATGNFEDMQDPNEQNYLFKVIDESPIELDGDVTQTQNLARISNACNASLTGSPFVDEGARGSYGVLKFPIGEKVVFDPVLGSGSLLFTTYKPDANSCGIGEGLIYGLHYSSCTEGLDTNSSDDLDAYTLRPGNPNVANGQLTGIAHDSESGNIQVGINNPTSLAGGGLVTASTEKKTRDKIDIPMLKLWWRQITP